MYLALLDETCGQPARIDFWHDVYGLDRGSRVAPVWLMSAIGFKMSTMKRAVLTEAWVTDVVPSSVASAPFLIKVPNMSQLMFLHISPFSCLCPILMSYLCVTCLCDMPSQNLAMPATSKADLEFSSPFVLVAKRTCELSVPHAYCHVSRLLSNVCAGVCVLL